ncbi:hypothetical protein RFI_16594 [Reticulomyxa filosa]|uniref:Uncharacterized protein n=1 Tax=Reticulomyxa filosa TaxID=46433 RepID=X6N2X1_RETFI|nr:hypothetical protein RFI_16594 [Reticulomyxa filosa]|eukprot:ETO20625.1 hypothetical protein RFI_16594 [Reticulomyxa filosa]
MSLSTSLPVVMNNEDMDKVYANCDMLVSLRETQGVLGMCQAWSTTVLFYDEQQIQGLLPTPLERQISECIESLRIEKGLQLLMKTNPTSETKRGFHSKAAFSLFVNMYFKQAMEHFMISDIDPRDVIYLFPKVRPAKMSYTIKHPMAPQQETVDDIIRVVAQWRRDKNVSTRERRDNVLNNSMLIEELAEYLRAIHYLGNMLWNRRVHPEMDELQIRDAEQKLAVDTALLKIYCEVQRCKKELRKLQHNQHSIIESSLLELPFPLEELLTKDYDNSCIIEECVSILSENSLYYAMALLYYSRSKADTSYTRNSLNILEEIGNKKWTDAANPNYDGVALMVTILSEMELCSDLWSFAEKLLRRSPAEGMKIFTKPMRIKRIPDNDVLEFLKERLQPSKDVSALMSGLNRLKSHQASSTRSNVEIQAMWQEVNEFDYVEAFLEHIVMTEHTIVPACHDELAFVYMSKIQKLVDIVGSKLSMFISKKKKKIIYIYVYVYVYIYVYTHISKVRLKKNMLNVCLFESSEWYAPEKLLEKAKTLELSEEMMELNKKLGRHDEALRILLKDINSFHRAVEYCLLAPHRSKDRSDRFVELIRIAFHMEWTKQQQQLQQQPPPTNPFANTKPSSLQLLPKIVTLLETYPQDINPSQVLRLLPADVPVYLLKKWFKKIIPTNLHRYRQTRVQRCLYQKKYLQTNVELINIKSNYGMIDFNTQCPCGKGFHDSTLFVLDKT